MYQPCTYIFDSQTANEAALAVRDGQCESIIHYHSTKHPQQQASPPQMQLAPTQACDTNLSPQKMKQRESKLNRLGQLAQLTTQPPPPPPQQQQPQPQQDLDPLSSLAALSEFPNLDNYTIHHRPLS